MAYNPSPVMAIIVFSLICAPPTSPFLCEKSTDCKALLKFKAAISSDPDGHLQSWNTTTSFCNWTGVTCHPKLPNRVQSLQLTNMSLRGKISSYISNLSLLNTLSLQENSFAGSIPASLGELSLLTYLNMSWNKLGGSVPETIKGCKSLRTIDFAVNNFSGKIPDGIGQLRNLTHLALSVNSLDGNLPESLSNLTELTNLQLAVNYFTGLIPEGIGELKKLKTLYLHTNYLEGKIPESISNCSALLHLDLLNNLLTGEIPSGMGTLYSLERLYLQMNKFTGSIPKTFGNLSQLTLLDLSLNKLTGAIPPEFGKLKKLDNLYLHSNDLVSYVNSSSLEVLVNCSFLRKLHLGSCLFTENLPASIGKFSKDLYYLNLLNNGFTGSIPDGIGNLSSLVTLYLWDNNFTGTIPRTIGKLGSLQRLDMGRNRLTGSIPEDVGLMANLGSMNLGDNRISGSIPSSLGNLVQLRYLYLSHYLFSGTIPIELTQCSDLLLLDLSFNALKGNLPTEIGRFSNMAFFFNLSNNKLQGIIPETIGNQAVVEAIDLSANNFSGEIPRSIGRCISLTYLNMSKNVLGGSITDSLKQIAYLKVLDLAFNKLTGRIPSWIGQDEVIKKANLSYNRLSGEVPNTGGFAKLGRSSLMGNAGLCGGSKILGLPPCEIEKQKHKDRKLVQYTLSISLVCASFLILLIMVYVHFWCRKKRVVRQEMVTRRHLQTRILTQRELEIATGGLDEANLLGTGSFGSVYKGSIDEGRTVVAVKVLNGECYQNYRNFIRECWILSEIKHRNLVKMLGISWSSQFKAIVLEYIGNGNLGEHLYPGRDEEGGGCTLTLTERMQIAIDIAHGLEYLHEGCPNQVVHCDLKPQNVLLDEDMVAHVADFGIAKLIMAHKPEGYDSSTTNFLRGTVGYIPPEYGQGTEVSARGDIYSFGVMILEMITGRPPTSRMFSDEIDIRKWVCSAFPHQVSEVVDISLKRQALAEDASGGVLSRYYQLCCAPLLEVAMSCTEESPQNRPPISLVAQELKKIQKQMKLNNNVTEKMRDGGEETLLQ